MDLIKIEFNSLQEFLRYVAATNLSPGGSGVPYIILLRARRTRDSGEQPTYLYDISSTGGDGIIVVYYKSNAEPGQYIWNVVKGDFVKVADVVTSVKGNEVSVFIQENIDSSFINSVV